MKKTVILMIFITIFLFIITGCNSYKDIENNLSERTELYFEGKNDIGKICGSISVGEREDPYIHDGVHNDTTGYSLISIMLTDCVKQEIETQIVINEKTQNFTLYFNPLNNSYMNDLGVKIKSTDEVFLRCSNECVKFENISQNFKIDDKKALKLIKKQYFEEIKTKFYENNKLKVEYYLKILHIKDDYKDLYWCFSVIGENGKFLNILISVNDENKVFYK